MHRYNPYDQYQQHALRAAAEAASAGAVSGIEMVGAYPYVGAPPAYPYVGGVDLVGAMAAQAQAQKLALARGAPYMPYGAPMAHGVEIPAPGVYSTENSPRVPRRKPAGFPIVTIGIGSTSAIAQLLPTEVIRPERLVIVDATSGQLSDVLVDDIKVGAQSQNIGQGPMTAEVFATTAFDTLFEGNTLNVGVPLSVSLRLTAPAISARMFALTIIGRSVTP